MLTVEGMMKKLLSMDGVYAAFIPTEQQLETFLEMESNTKTSTGMPLHNKSLEECRKRSHHICVFQKNSMVKVNHHILTMLNKNGELAGFDVPPALRHEVAGRDDLIWISDDFVLDPLYATGPCELVMDPYPTELLSEVAGIHDAILLIPSAPVDEVMRETYLISRSPSLLSAIISFDIDPEEYESIGVPISSLCFQTSKVHCH